jgi:alpha-D-xyloside xylohydrolase
VASSEAPVRSKHSLVIRPALIVAASLLAVTARPYERRGDGVRLRLEDSGGGDATYLRIRVHSADVVQVVATRKAGSEPVSLIHDEAGSPPTTGFRTEETGEVLRVSSGDLRVEITKRTGRVAFVGPDGSVLLREGKRRIVPAVVSGEKAYHVQQGFEWASDEALYGLGQHQEGVYDWRGHYVELVQYNRRAVVPFLLSSRGYGLLWDNYSYTKVSDTAYGSHLWSDVGDGVDYYFIYGPEADAVIRRYRELTGEAPLFPKWAYGYIQSKERYKTQEELLDIARGYRERGIPMDCVVQDWQYWPQGLWGQKSFDPARFPDPAAMMRTLHGALHTHLMISIWPKMAERSADYREMREHPGFLYPDGDSPFYDAFNPQARALYWKQANEGLFSEGIDAWWCDATEPELDGWDFNIDAYKNQMKPSIGSGARFMNAYSLMHAKGIYENQRSTTRAKRVVNLTRSAFAGQQRYATITWSGDLNATWDVFRRQIPAGLNFSMSGLPYWTTDIGGFFVQSANVGALGHGMWFREGGFDRGLEDDGYKELYVRWFQYGAFCPIFRAHGTDVPREIWRFGEPGDWAYDALVKADQLRYRLMPYLYSTAWKVTREGYTLMRGLVMDFPSDPQVLDLGDQYMFGAAFLVSPVTRPGDRFRTVYLPIGTDWYQFWTGKRYSGGQTLQPPAPIDEMPLFVRAGSIVPMGPSIQYATESADPIELRVYPGADGRFALYEDEGDGYAYEKGAFAVIPIEWNDAQQTLTIGARRGSFPGMLDRRTFQVVFVGRDHGTGLERPQPPDATIAYAGAAVTVSAP